MRTIPKLLLIITVGWAVTGCFATNRIAINQDGLMALVLSPQGDYSLFFCSDCGHQDLYLFNTSELSIKQITHDGNPKGFAQWSPDGQHLIYIDYQINDRGEVQTSSLKVYDHVTNNVKTLRTIAGTDLLLNPQFSPDGQWIAYRTINAQEASILEVIHSQTGIRRYARGSGSLEGSIFAYLWRPQGDLLALKVRTATKIRDDIQNILADLVLLDPFGKTEEKLLMQFLIPKSWLLVYLYSPWLLFDLSPDGKRLLISLPRYSIAFPEFEGGVGSVFNFAL